MANRIPIRGENKALREQVEKLNQKYFGGLLKINEVGYFTDVNYQTIAQAQFSGELIVGVGGRGFIAIGVNPIFMKVPFDLTDTLVHEMIHVWQYQTGNIDRDREGHGKWVCAMGAKIMKRDPQREITRYSTRAEARMIELLQKMRMAKANVRPRN
jgi:hypothetical protein